MRTGGLRLIWSNPKMKGMPPLYVLNDHTLNPDLGVQADGSRRDHHRVQVRITVGLAAFLPYSVFIPTPHSAPSHSSPSCPCPCPCPWDFAPLALLPFLSLSLGLCIVSTTPHSPSAVGGRRVVETNLQNKGLISADRGTRATLMRTIPRSLFKSYTKDLLFPIFELVF